MHGCGMCAYRSGGADGRDMTKPPSSMEGGFVGAGAADGLPGVGHRWFRGDGRTRRAPSGQYSEGSRRVVA